MEQGRTVRFATPSAGLRYWSPADDSRYPWCRASVADEVRAWMTEAESADVLAEAGERVYPLLLSGETRCGKTSLLIECARYFGVHAYRMSMGSIVNSYMGETAKSLKDALEEAAVSQAALWILDEVDGVFQRRSGETGANKEMNLAIAVALTAIESVPQHVMLAATTNELRLIDKAMLARFRCVAYPAWSELAEDERREFARSHGYETAWSETSYARVVHAARNERVRKILAKAEKSKRK